MSAARRRRTTLLSALLLAACARSVQPPAATAPPVGGEPPGLAAAGPPAPAPEVIVELPATSPTAPAPVPAVAPPARPPAPPILPEPVVTPRLPRLLRVGLATDLAALRLPCCDAVAEADGRTLMVGEALVVAPAPGAAAPPSFRVQVAALKDEAQAHQLAERVGRQMRQPADSVFDAGSDLYRVRVGRYADRSAAEDAGRRLETLGLKRAWVVSEQGHLTDPGLRISGGGRSVRVAGRWLALAPRLAEGLPFAGGRYRGRLLAYLNDRGTLNVVNELPLEDYLRGVLPREMGPEVYKNLEALKAQAVAARTYTLRNLEEFAGEGYDICATPRCQVYGGMGAEHPLSDEAIRDTAGQVLLYHGALVDALYSATCGGHTEDGGVVFPLKNYPYLKGVPCLEAGVHRLASGPAGPAPLAAAVMRRLLPSPAGVGAAQALGERLLRLARLSGLPAPADRLASLERREVQRFLASVFDLALDARLFVESGQVGELVDSPPPGWRGEDLRLAAYLRESGLLGAPSTAVLDDEEAEDLLLQLALFLHVVETDEVGYQSLDGGSLAVRRGEQAHAYAVPAGLPTFRGAAAGTRAAALSLLPGDGLVLYRHGDELLAVLQEVDGDAAPDLSSRLKAWTRYRSDGELTALVEARYPGLGFKSFDILARGSSGRVARMRLVGREGRTVEVEGLAVRWTLDLPDTWFTARRVTPPDRPAGWLFTGRGWGHGVGLCQVGAYGMGLRGHGYREILQHYYTGVEVVRLTEAEEAATAAR